MTATDPRDGIDRRTFLRATGGAAAATTVAGAAAGSPAAAPGDDLDA